MGTDRYNFLKGHGICVSCGQCDAFPGHTKCADCIEKANLASAKCWDDPEKKIKYAKRGNETKKKLYQERKSAGLCVRCGKQTGGGVYCGLHRAKRNLARRTGREYGVAFRERMDRGVCMYCGEVVVPGYRFCERHLEARRKIIKRTLGEKDICERWRKEITAEWEAKKMNFGNG
nr:MAG TPA: hypothetical protein [Bacteriophage sp.]